VLKKRNEIILIMQKSFPKFYFNYEIFKKHNILNTFKLQIVFQLKTITIFNSKYFFNEINNYK